MRRRLVAATAAVLLALGVAGVTVEPTLTSGRGVYVQGSPTTSR